LSAQAFDKSPQASDGEWRIPHRRDEEPNESAGLLDRVNGSAITFELRRVSEQRI